MNRPGGTLFVDGRPAVVLGVEPLDEWDLDTGERRERVTVLQFAPPAGRDHLCTPTLSTVITRGDEQNGAARSRHNDVRTLCAWLGGQKRALDTRQLDLVRALADLERLAS